MKFKNFEKAIVQESAIYGEQNMANRKYMEHNNLFYKGLEKLTWHSKNYSYKRWHSPLEHDVDRLAIQSITFPWPKGWNISKVK